MTQLEILTKDAILTYITDKETLMVRVFAYQHWQGYWTIRVILFSLTLAMCREISTMQLYVYS